MGLRGAHHSGVPWQSTCEQGKGASGPGRVWMFPRLCEGSGVHKTETLSSRDQVPEGLSWHRGSLRSQASLRGPFELTAESKEACLFHMTYQSRHSCL